jgi:hypothetical protein
LIPRIHTFAALGTFFNLLVYAISGFAPRSNTAPTVWDQPFTTAPGETDRAIATRAVLLLGLGLAAPVHDFNIAHDSAGRLALDFYHANGRHKVTVLPGHLHIEAARAPLAKYLSTLHVTTAAFHSGDRRLQCWAWYNEFAMWMFAVLLGTGAWMLVTRRGRGGTIRRTHWIVAWIALPVLAVFAVSAVQMAHRTWWTVGPVLRALALLHRARGLAPAPFAGALLLLVAATGFCLWLQSRRDRLAGAIVLALGAVLSGGLMVWMRVG